MRLYTCFTKTHKWLLDDYFLPSLIPDEYQLTVREFEQRTITGNQVEKAAFAETCRDKMQMCADAVRIAQKEGEQFFLYSDCDVMFCKPSKETLRMAIVGKDMVAMNDRSIVGAKRAGNPKVTKLCIGFFICRATDTMWKVFQDTMLRIGVTLDVKRGPIDDQTVINEKRLRTRFRNCVLDPELFWNYRIRWQAGMDLPVPLNVLVFHANWANDMFNKQLMLERVKQTLLTHSKEEASE